MLATDQLKAVLFDLDGTLINTIDIYFELLEQVFEEFGAKMPSRELIRHLMFYEGGYWENWDKAVTGDEGGVLKAKIWEIFHQRVRERYSEMVDFLPGAVETLKYLHRGKYMLGLVTSSKLADHKHLFSGTRDVILHSLLDVIITRDSVSRLKPAPDPILAAIEKLGVEPASTVYVGDTPLDIISGRAAGVKTVAVLSGLGTREILQKEKSDLILDDITGLSGIL